jgi:ferredoxin
MPRRVCTLSIKFLVLQCSTPVGPSCLVTYRESKQPLRPTQPPVQCVQSPVNWQWLTTQFHVPAMSRMHGVVLELLSTPLWCDACGACTQACLEKVIVTQIVTEFFAFHRTRRFVAVDTRTRPCTSYKFSYTCKLGRLCGLAVRVQRSGFDSRRYQIFWEVVGLEQEQEEKVATPV